MKIAAVSLATVSSYLHTELIPQAKELSERVSRVATRCLKSPLFLTGCALITLAACAPVVPFPLFALALGLALPVIYLNRKRLLYEISIIPTIFSCCVKNYPWSHEIVPNSLRLSAIPLKNVPQEVHGANRAIVTMLEEHELKASIFSEPVLSEEWKRRGVPQLHLPAPDYHGVSLDHFQEAVAFVKQEIDNGREVTVHCKAGRGRSAAIVIAYLLVHGKGHGISLTTVDDAISYVKKRRAVISINFWQKRALEKYWSAQQRTKGRVSLQ
jgi:atypical dual specificity phosphatase